MGVEDDDEIDKDAAAGLVEHALGMLKPVDLADVLTVFRAGEIELDHVAITERLQEAGLLHEGFTPAWIRDCIEAAVVPFRHGDRDQIGLSKHVYRRSNIKAAAAGTKES